VEAARLYRREFERFFGELERRATRYGALGFYFIF
jgi:hypothetical protein